LSIYRAYDADALMESGNDNTLNKCYIYPETAPNRALNLAFLAKGGATIAVSPVRALHQQIKASLHLG
jgi:hypothetical protein